MSASVPLSRCLIFVTKTYLAPEDDPGPQGRSSRSSVPLLKRPCEACRERPRRACSGALLVLPSDSLESSVMTPPPARGGARRGDPSRLRGKPLAVVRGPPGAGPASDTASRSELSTSATPLRSSLPSLALGLPGLARAASRPLLAHAQGPPILAREPESRNREQRSRGGHADYLCRLREVDAATVARSGEQGPNQRRDDGLKLSSHAHMSQHATGDAGGRCSFASWDLGLTFASSPLFRRDARPSLRDALPARKNENICSASVAWRGRIPAIRSKALKLRPSSFLSRLSRSASYPNSNHR